MLFLSSRKIFAGEEDWSRGTLDPDVTGVLPIAVGKATRMIEYMQEEGKILRGGDYPRRPTTTKMRRAVPC